MTEFMQGSVLGLVVGILATLAVMMMVMPEVK